MKLDELKEENLIKKNFNILILKITKPHQFSINQKKIIRNPDEEPKHPFENLEKALRQMHVACVNYKNGLSFFLRKKKSNQIKKEKQLN